jgi:hypothetical protein
MKCHNYRTDPFKDRPFQVSWEEMQDLMEQMYNAADVPQDVRQRYKISVGEWLAIRACN